MKMQIQYTLFLMDFLELKHWNFTITVMYLEMVITIVVHLRVQCAIFKLAYKLYHVMFGH